jgi:hypothetical protein
MKALWTLVVCAYMPACGSPGGPGTTTSTGAGGFSTTTTAGSTTATDSTTTTATDSTTTTATDSTTTTGSTAYATVTINFDDLSNKTKVTTQYATHATFSSNTGVDVIAFDPSSWPFGQSPPNFICGGSQCTGDLFVDFAKPVRNLRFRAIGADKTGQVATLHVFQGSTAEPAQHLDGKGDDTVPVDVDLSSFTGVTRLEVVSITDPGGLGLDDLVFDFPL